MNKSGWFSHVHHNVLVEWSDDIDERIEFIKKHTNAAEIPTRLRLLKQVVFPEQADVQQACAAWQQAYAAWEQAYATLLPILEKLHAEQCPDCPWDGHS